MDFKETCIAGGIQKAFSCLIAKIVTFQMDIYI